MTVLIDQDQIQDFLVALENSPMAIQVCDFEMAKPAQPRRQAREGRPDELRRLRRHGGMPAAAAWR